MGEGQKLRFGLVGGGEGAFIGAVHRLAAELDGEAELVAACCGSTPERARRAAQAIYRVPAERAYGTTREMFAAERSLPAARRMHFVIIATPNSSHVTIAGEALEAGFHVVCDKPLAADLATAEVLRDHQAASGCRFAVTYNYTGYPMVREARELIAAGGLGAIRRVQCEYLQGWLAEPLEAVNKQASWRTDPARAGASGCFGDIGSHAENLVSYVTGLRIAHLCADLASFVPGRRLDDDGNVLLRFHGGARGVISASQVAVGEENALRLRVYGEHGGLEWSQQEPNSLLLRLADRPLQVLRTGTGGLGALTTMSTRLPGGHPEGFLEAFANIYRGFMADLRGTPAGDYPCLEDGIRGMRFLDRVVASDRAGGVWVAVEENA
ncbi:MAG: Gfo/Idh/MocA family oxidoreductase [Pseudomonadales bacterium]|nr:Gfo/Idh/MocA family oxidoreductase [Pseudomonadales bacterium]MCP5182315.1 Gfo/Idh/MocA family oxidoreductase [Pseudomonadales bacterium]